jgi:predicted dehydrogenase
MKVRWGVLGAARIATAKVVPAMQQSALLEVAAIASRDEGRARQTAAALGIPKAYGSYEALLADPEIDAVYNPLPNHLHVPWSLRAIAAGKHVLCEKPIALTADEAGTLLQARDRAGVKVQEAFMIRTSPQWIGAIEAIRAGRLGSIRAVAGVFSFFKDDPANVRNVASFGGGALLDIGCYLIHSSRWIFGREPERVVSLVERDPRFGVDRLTSMLLDFGVGHAVGTCSTQQASYQRIHVLGTRGRLEIEIPFNAPADRPCRVFIGAAHDAPGAAAEVLEYPACDQYRIEADAFSRAILDDSPVPLPLEESVLNMRVIDAVMRSAQSGGWEQLPAIT